MPETAAFRPLETAADAAKRRKTAEPDEALAESFVREALDDDAAAVVVTEARHPFKIVYVNDAWARLCEFDKAECVGKSNQLIQGPETDFELCRRKMAELLAPPHTCAMTQVNYKQSGEPFRNRVTIRPVLDAAREPRYFVAKLDQEDPPPGLALGGAGVVLQPPAAAAA
ncbi:PAS domain-containing protein [Aureococcus anophagefferens]|nr:PAS domain-containing protein [Aureococcus anophagefferens]